MATSADPDETPRSAASCLGVHCLLRPVCLNTYDIYGILNIRTPSALAVFILKTEQIQIGVCFFFF